MRFRWACAALVIPASGSAQTAAWQLMQDGYRVLQQRQIVPTPTQESPTQPTGNPGLPPKYPQEAPEEGDTGVNRLEIIRAGSTTREGQFVHLEGGVELTYQGYRVIADTVDGNMGTRIFDAQGHVVITGKESVVVGQRVIVDFRNRTYESYSAESQISPEVLQGQVLDNVYVRGRESSGSERETTSHDAHFTTCNLNNPHYGIAADEVVVRPGKRAIFRKARIRLFGRTILSLPFLSIPLEERTYRYLPVVGVSDEEGYFIKNRYGIPLRGDNNFDARLDYMTKLGTGYGGDYNYSGRNIAGVTSFYAVTGKTNTLTMNNQHRQQFRWGTLTLDNDYQRNNYYWSSTSTSLTTRAVLDLPQRSGSTRLSYQRYGTDSSGSSSNNQQISLSDSRSFGSKTRTTFDVNYGDTSSSYGGSSTDMKTMDVRFHGQRDLPWATTSLDYQRSIPIGDASQFVGASDRTPLLTIASDAQRLLGQKWAMILPFRTDLSLGEFSDPTNQGHLSRGAFNFNFQKPDFSSRRFRFDQYGQFQQTMYSDDTAQYVLGYNSAASYRLGRDTSANLRYNYLRPYGYSPMLLDQTGQTNQVSTDLSFRLARPLLLGAQTGYDILQLQQGYNSAWQQVGVRAEYTPTPWVLMRSLATYDTFSQAWSNVRIDMTWRPGATTIGLGARYDGFNHTWGNLNLYIDSLKIGRTRFSTLLAFNGYTRQLDAQQYSFIYDLHCAEAVLTYVQTGVGYKPGRDIQLFIRLKAIPFDSIFGTGARGAPSGVGTGRDF